VADRRVTPRKPDAIVTKAHFARSAL